MMGLAWPTKPTQQRKREKEERERKNERKGFVKINKKNKTKIFDFVSDLGLQKKKTKIDSKRNHKFSSRPFFVPSFH